MQTPPPFNRPNEGYYQQAPKPKKNPVVVIFAILGVLLVCCGGPLGLAAFYGNKLFKGGIGMVSCFANTSRMSSALTEYTKANGGKLPNAATWQTDISKYLKSKKSDEEVPFALWTAGGEWSCGTETNKTGFMFNKLYSGKSAAEVAKANAEAPVIFETNTVAFNQSGEYKALPFDSSPKLFEAMDEKRGWMLVTAEGVMGSINKKGAFKKLGTGKNDGFNFDFDTETSDKAPAAKDSANSE